MQKTYKHILTGAVVLSVITLLISGIEAHGGVANTLLAYLVFGAGFILLYAAVGA